ncbi:phosphoribosyltransferase-like protein [Oceanospirillum beijerinckii]|uniref:phosphoribosyltransferase-like protein n=1 Tax=Oceanospirillum beijerinckii TaxID=64976 RepID=UPI0004219D63|nr:hypothetical protein [Oceanospirillum beijerinckii]
MSRLECTKEGLAWLQQFDSEDKADAEKLLKAFRWVSNNEFSEAIHCLLQKELDRSANLISIYVEKETDRNKPFFREEKKKPHTASGKPNQAFIKDSARDIGSEGVISTIVSGFKRSKENGSIIINPTVEDFKNKRIRNLIVVTDFIGTGERICKLLYSLWLVRTIKSWVSLGWLEINIVAYSCTKDGKNKIERHPISPRIKFCLECPTINSSFGHELDRRRIKSLCDKYDPENKKNMPSFAYNYVEALIAFEHSAPNNIPNIFYKRSNSWSPLFPNRVTTSVASEVASGYHELDSEFVLENQRQKRIARTGWLKKQSPAAKEMLTVLGAISRKPRSIDAISARTGIDKFRIAKIVSDAINYEWIDETLRLTDLGHAQINYFKSIQDEKIVEREPYKDYYPSSLRVPV